MLRGIIILPLTQFAVAFTMNLLMYLSAVRKSADISHKGRRQQQQADRNLMGLEKSQKSLDMGATRNHAPPYFEEENNLLLHWLCQAYYIMESNIDISSSLRWRVYYET